MPLDGTPGQTAGSEATPAGETRVELQTPITDEQSAASALEGILDWDRASGDGDDDDTKSGASAPDAGAGESQPTGDEEGQSEPQEGQPPAPAAIEPPNSWSAEDKALFGKLPPEAQAVIARRESERDRVINERTQEIAEHRKAAEAERAAIAGQRDTYVQSLNQLLQLAVPEAQALAQVDWQRLSVENPAEYVRLSAQRDQLRERVGRLQGEMQRTQQQAQAELAQRHQGFLAEQKKMLVEKLPEFADPQKGPQFAKDLATHLATYGFSSDEIGQAADHRLVLMARDAMLYRQAEAARKTAEAKRQNTAPAVQQPGTAAAADDGANKRLQGKVQNFGRTNSVRDAASLLMDLL